jgi:serine/threonine-protein kinase
VLRRGQTIVKLGPQPLKALALLVRRAGDLVTREELRRAIWNDQTNVDYEHGINTCIRQIRTALGREVGAELIETAPRLGYRFKARVERVAAAPPEKAAKSRRVWLRAGALLILVAIAAAAVVYQNRRKTESAPVKIRLVVLPIPAGDDQADLWNRGLAEDLTTRLGVVEGVQAIAATSAFSVGMPAVSLPDVGRHLAADSIVTLRTRRSAGAFEVGVRLVGLPDEREIWSQQLTRAEHEAFAMQSEIAASLASVLRRPLQRDEKRWPTQSPQAFELYLRGRELTERGGQTARLGLELFEQAGALDPAFAQAHAAMASVLLRRTAATGVPARQRDDRARKAVERALALAPSLPEAHLAAAQLKSSARDWEGTEREYRRAIELAPNRSDAHEEYATWLSLHGRFMEAIAEADEALLLDRLSPRAHYTAGLVRRFARFCDDARPHLQKALELDPQYGSAHHEMGQCYQMSGRHDLAIEAYRRGAQPVGNLGHALAMSGRTTEARALLVQLIEQHRQTGAEAALIAMIYVGLGEYERALDWLEEAADAPGGPPTWKVAAVWDPLRSHPRFAQILRKVDLSPSFPAR